MKPLVNALRKKKYETKKGKEEKKREKKSQDSLLSPHAGTLRAKILHLDQKAPKCMTCRRLCGKF